MPAQQRGASRQVAQLGHRRRPRPHQALLPAALSPTKRAAHAAVRIHRQQCAATTASQSHQARSSAHPSGSARPSVSLCCLRLHVWALQRTVATARGWVTRFRTRKLKIAKMASDLHRRAWEGAEEATTTFLTSSTSLPREYNSRRPDDKQRLSNDAYKPYHKA